MLLFVVFISVCLFVDCTKVRGQPDPVVVRSRREHLVSGLFISYPLSFPLPSGSFLLVASFFLFSLCVVLLSTPIVSGGSLLFSQLTNNIGFWTYPNPLLLFKTLVFSVLKLE